MVNLYLYRIVQIFYKVKNLNLYNTKIISCKNCGKCCGEVDDDCEITQPLCGKCAHPVQKEMNSLIL